MAQETRSDDQQKPPRIPVVFISTLNPAGRSIKSAGRAIKTSGWGNKSTGWPL